MTRPVVVVVLSHRDPQQVDRLVARALAGERTHVLVHHDPRGPRLDLRAHPRLYVAPDPRAARWGRFDLAEVVLTMIALAFERVPDLAWVLVVSGQDYPCRAMARIEAELAATTANAFVRAFPVDRDPADDVHPWQRRVRTRYLRRLRLPGTHRSVPFPRRHPFGGPVHLYAGDMWVTLDASAGRHLLAQRERLPHVERYLRRCSVPDEALLPTLLLNDAQHLRIEPDRRRYIRWVEGHPHPETLGVEDLDAIVGGADFFARKVHPVASAELLDQLDDRAREDDLTVDRS